MKCSIQKCHFMRFHRGLHDMRFCVEIDGLLKNLGRTKTLPSRSLFLWCCKNDWQFKFAKRKGLLPKYFHLTVRHIADSSLAKKYIPGFCSLPLCCTSEVANVRHWGARHRAFQYYIHHVCTLHACHRLFCKRFCMVSSLQQKRQIQLPLELGSDFTCKFIRVDVCFVHCFISLCWFFVKFSGNSIQANCHLMSVSFCPEVKLFWPKI